ncbi:hypothetical protein EGH10_17495 [Brevibacillus laterosporus]|nr:hypothetical protein DM460_22335 [Brevibacillus laterosporus]TPH07255.1 hypothetical protein EGH10_17495 [Brevibacillus laterosporus]
MWEEIFTLVKENPAWSLLFTFLGSFTVWLYKEFNVMITADDKNKLSLIQKKMDLYGKLEAVTANVINQKDDIKALQNLYNKLGESSSYFTEDIRKIIRDFYKRGDTSLLPTLMAYFEMEITKLAKNKSILESLDIPTNTIEYILRLFRPLKPIIVIFLILLAIALYILLVLQHNNVWSKTFLTVIFISSVFSIMVLSAILSLWLDKKLPRQGKYNSLLNACMIFSPILSFWDVRLSIIVLIVQIVSLIMYGQNKNSNKLII